MSGIQEVILTVDKLVYPFLHLGWAVKRNKQEDEHQEPVPWKLAWRTDNIDPVSYGVSS